MTHSAIKKHLQLGAISHYSLWVYFSISSCWYSFTYSK